MTIRLDRDCGRGDQARRAKPVRTLVLAIAAGCTAPGASGEALINASPDDNDAILATLLTTGALYNAAVSADVFNPDPATALLTFGASWALQNALRLIPPYFDPPADRSVYTTWDNNGDGCSYEYDLPVNEASYSNYLGIVNLGLKDEDWGLFDAPFVQHWDSTVAVRMSGLAAGSHREIGEGRYTLHWQAATQYSFLFDVLTPPAIYYLYNKILKNPRYATDVAASAFVEVASRAVDVGVNEAQAYLDAVDANPDIYNPYELVSTDSASNNATRTLTVWDIHPPYFRDASTASRIRDQAVVLEARDFGGVRWNRVKDEVRARFAPTDDCGRPLITLAVDPPSLIPIGGKGTEIEWHTSDGGPYNVSSATPGYLLAPNNIEDAGAEDVYAVLKQRLFVVDTQAPILVAPDGFAVESATPVAKSSLNLGVAQVVDLADPFPTVTDNAPGSFNVDQRYLISYTAMDASGNQTLAPPGDPYRYTQAITVKTPGTNTAPIAAAVDAATLTSEPVELLLTGTDSDCLPVANALVPDDPGCPGGIADPLRFAIDTPPANGSFEAPLKPFFIEDLRLTPLERVVDNTWQTLTCPTDLNDAREFEGKLAQLDRVEHTLYVEKCYCPQSGPQTAPPGA